MSRKNLEFFKQQLSEIEKVAAETGEFKKVAEFLGVSSVTLRTYRKKDKKLEQVILNGLSKSEALPSKAGRFSHQNDFQCSS